jgi:hypothetical protein
MSDLPDLRNNPYLYSPQKLEKANRYRENLRENVTQFRLVTMADERTAQHWLRNNGNDVGRATDMYFVRTTQEAQSHPEKSHTKCWHMSKRKDFKPKQNDYEYDSDNVPELEGGGSSESEGHTSPELESEGKVASYKNNDPPPNIFLCPITKKAMDDPVVASDGHTYERSSLEDHFKACEKRSEECTSPMTKEALKVESISPTNIRQVTMFSNRVLLAFLRKKSPA